MKEASSPQSPRRSPARRVVLTGFMGSGKTTVGRQLAGRLGWEFADLDDHVALRERCLVPALIAGRGEAAFRVAEAEALADLLLRSPLVIALGGGAPETPSVQAMLRNAAGTVIVHLRAPFDLLYERCRLQANDTLAAARPLLGDRTPTAHRYERRLPLYENLAHLTIDAGEGAPETVAEAVLVAIGWPLAGAHRG